MLFLSVDVIGSTAYKNSKSEEIQPWLSFFLDFYKEFDILLQHQFDCGQSGREFQPNSDSL